MYIDDIGLLIIGLVVLGALYLFGLYEKFPTAGIKLIIYIYISSCLMLYGCSFWNHLENNSYLLGPKGLGTYFGYYYVVISTAYSSLLWYYEDNLEEIREANEIIGKHFIMLMFLLGVTYIPVFMRLSSIVPYQTSFYLLLLVTCFVHTFIIMLHAGEVNKTLQEMKKIMLEDCKYHTCPRCGTGMSIQDQGFTIFEICFNCHHISTSRITKKS